MQTIEYIFKYIYSMALETIYRGEDKDIEITLSDDAGDPLLISGLTGIIIWIVNKSTGGVLGKFSLKTLAGHDPIATIDGPNGVIQLKLTAAQTRTADKGCLVAEIKVRITPTGTYDSIEPIEIAKLADAYTKDVTTFS